MAADPWVKRSAEIAAAIRSRRETAGLTQEQLAHAAGISRNHLQVLERGVGAPSNPRLATLYSLAAVLKVHVVELLPRDAR